MQAVEQIADDARFLDEVRAGRCPVRSSPLVEPQQRAVDALLDQVILQRALVLQVLLGLAARHLVERRLRDVEMAALDQFRHLPEEEGQQQRADMAAVHVGVRHDDDLVVAQLVGVELVLADARAERRDQRADFLARQHLVEARALDVQDLAAQRQDGLVLAVAALLGGAAGRVALDDEEFGLGGIALLAIGELAGQGGDVERALAARQFARLAGGFARRGRLDDLADDGLARFAGMLLEPCRAAPRSATFSTTGRTSDETSLSLVCDENFGSGTLTDRTAGQALAAIVAGRASTFSFFVRPDAFAVARHLARQRGAEAGQMGAAVALRNVVGEAQHVLVVAVVPPQRDFDGDAVPLAADHQRRSAMSGVLARSR